MAEIHHLRPTAEIAPMALLPGDPGRALALSQALLDRPLMANHARGLWGYTGRTEAGTLLTVQSTGLGGPSLAVVVAELHELGVHSAVRLGTCRALRTGLEPGDPMIVGAAIPGDGASLKLGASSPLHPDRELTDRLSDDGSRPVGTVASTDLHHDDELNRGRDELMASGAIAVDLASATLLALGPRLGMRVASCLVVAEAVDGRRATDELIEVASLALGRVSLRALQAA